MPSRPQQHVLEDESRTAFATLVLPWVFRDKRSDYGIDAEVEIFEQGKATGQLFLVQLKATAKLEGKTGVSFNIEWIHYFKSLELPVFIVLWVKASNTFFWTWASEIDLYYAKPGAKTYTVPLVHQWNSHTTKQIRKHLDLRRGLLTQSIPFPLRVSIEGPKYRLPELQMQLRAILANAPRLVRYNDDGADIAATLGKDELRVSFHGLPGVVFHSMDGVSADGVAQRVVIGAVITFANFGALLNSGRLWTGVPRLVDGVSSVDVAWCIASVLARTAAYAELLELVRALKLRLGNAITAPLFTLYFTAPAHRKQELGNVLSALERDDLQLEVPEARSIALYNLAKLANERRDTVRYFHKALKESRFYFKKSYFWAELGAELFSSGRYSAARCAYHHAYVKLGHAERKSHYADALMHTGSYREALNAFKAIAMDGTKSPLTPEVAEARIKIAVLELIVNKFDIPTQWRQSRLAAAALGEYMQNGISNAEMMSRTKAAIDLDALYSVAWFNRAQALSRSGKEVDAMLGFLAAAAVRTPDDESWLGAIVLAGRHDQGLFQSLLTYLPYIRGGQFIRYLAEHAQRQPTEAGRRFFDGMAQLFTENLPKREDAIIRVHGSKGGNPALIIEASENGIDVQRISHKKKKRKRKLGGKQQRKNRAKSKRKK